MMEVSEKERKEVSGFGTYLMGNWTGIYDLETLDIPGSCTEGMFSETQILDIQFMHHFLSALVNIIIANMYFFQRQTRAM